MGIKVECPNGHVFKVKDKYAGKKGLCPQCEGQVVVQVPDLIQTTSATIQKSNNPVPPIEDPGSSSIFDEPASQTAASSGSLLSGSFIQHRILCTKCGEKAPMWYARCPNCGEYLDHG
jgi:hypothetical protein